MVQGQTTPELHDIEDKNCSVAPKALPHLGIVCQPQLQPMGTALHWTAKALDKAKWLHDDQKKVRHNHQGNHSIKPCLVHKLKTATTWQRRAKDNLKRVFRSLRPGGPSLILNSMGVSDN